MLAFEMKKQLIEKIESTENMTLLEEVYRLLDMDEDNFEIYQLSDEQKIAIDQGLEDVKNERVISHEDAKKEVEEWFLR